MLFSVFSLIFSSLADISVDRLGTNGQQTVDQNIHQPFHICNFLPCNNLCPSLHRKLRLVLTNRIIKFFLENSKRDPTKYLEFYQDYGLFFREGIVTTPEQDQRVRLAPEGFVLIHSRLKHPKLPDYFGNFIYYNTYYLFFQQKTTNIFIYVSS